MQQKKIQETTQISPKDALPIDASSKSIILTAADRRAQFQSNKSTTGNNDRKLVRAMSAPIRPIIDDSSAKALQGKRRILRRKKNLGRDRFGGDADGGTSLQTQLFFEGDEDDDILLSTASVKAKSSVLTKGGANSTLMNCNQQQNRSRTVLSGCDVVTLVSLLSSGGSDSEREDCSTPTKNGDAIVATIGATNVGKAPMLSKTGKSGKYSCICFKATGLQRYY